MAKLKIGSITVIVNGYYDNNGKPYFQQSVPTDLRKRVGKSKISVPLKPEHGHVAVQCQRLTEKWAALFKAMRDDASLTPSEVRQAAISKLALFGLKPGDGNLELPMPKGHQGSFNSGAHLEAFEDAIEEDFYRGDPVAVAAYEALRKPLPVLLSEAFTIYLDNNDKGRDAKFQADQLQHWNKLVKLFGDIPVTQLSRDHAREYRDHRSNTGVKAATIKRELNTLAAIVNTVFSELTINQVNPFKKLTVHKTQENQSEQRLPYSRTEIQLLLDKATAIDDERRRLVIMLALTGARLAEVVGLRRIDVDISNQSINITPHMSRTLKTPDSERVVPLLPVACRTLETQMQGHSSDFVFPTYAALGKVKSDSASATLNKWARTLIPSDNKTMHSLRHAMRDQLRLCGCPEEISDAIGGWSETKRVSTGYGLGYDLETKRKWLTLAYNWLDAEVRRHG